MPQVTINLDETSNLNIDIYRAKNKLKSKKKAVELVIKKFFKP